MTTARLIALRTFSATLGRIPAASRLLRRSLTAVLITKRSENRYVATSRFFDWKDLDET